MLLFCFAFRFFFFVWTPATRPPVWRSGHNGPKRSFLRDGSFSVIVIPILLDLLIKAPFVIRMRICIKHTTKMTNFGNY